jgi:hypothetical protein
MISPLYCWRPRGRFRGSGLRALLACALVFSAFNDLRAGEPPHPCASLGNDDERLACYDRAFGKPPQPSNGASPGPEPGLGDQSPSEKKSARITATVTAFERRRDGLFVVTLDNGQVWSQTELDSRAEVRVGDTVKLRRGALGSYLLSTSAGIGTRVRRVR